MMVPGSYKWGPEKRATWEEWLDPDEIYYLRVPAGSAMLWRPTLLHAVTPNLSNNIRKALYISYTPRWVRPSGFMEQDPELLARCSPIRQQLLGSIPHGRHPLGQDPVGNPSSQYWFVDDWDNVPLKAWAEEQAGDGPYDWGTGQGFSHIKGPDFMFTQVKMHEKKKA
jgi:hypothetical protein